MNLEATPGKETEKIREALDRIREDLPAMSNLIDAFGDLIIERTRFRESLTGFGTPPDLEIDPDRFRQGVPLALRETLVIPKEELERAAREIFPALEKGFPAIASALKTITDAISDGRLDLEAVSTSLLRQEFRGVETAAADLGLEQDIVAFILGQAIKPFVERQAAAMTPLPEGLEWVKGYCPICGSWPSMSFLIGKEGQRWLKCSLCAHEWRFMRTECPFCENDDFETMEYFFSEDRPHERAEVCHKCKKYIVSVDRRDLAQDVVLEVAGLGMVYLDILAQQKGFQPGASTEWNMTGVDEQSSGGQGDPS